MKGLISYTAWSAALALLCLDCGFAEQPRLRIAAASAIPTAVACTSVPPDMTRMPVARKMRVQTIEANGEKPGESSVEQSASSEIENSDVMATEALIDEGALLLPTWDRGFWAMPPGGLTRFLIPPRDFINPEQNLPPGPSGVNSG